MPVSFNSFSARTLLNENTPGAQLFHKDIGIPPQLHGPMPGLRLQYSNHAKQEALKDNLTKVPGILPMYTLIEIESVQGQATKFVLRFPLQDDRNDRDIVLVVLPDGFVKTIWTNSRTDQHKTLKKHLYTPPSQYQANVRKYV